MLGGTRDLETFALVPFLPDMGGRGGGGEGGGELRGDMSSNPSVGQLDVHTVFWCVFFGVLLLLSGNE